MSAVLSRDDPCLPEPVVILGGGLAGLSASVASGAPVYEGEGIVGGAAASDRTDGFVFDRGIHVLQTDNARILTLLGKAGVRLNRRSRRAFIYSHGVYTPYPFQVNTVGLPLPLRMRCLRDYLLRDRTTTPRNYEEWIYSSVGRGFADTFLIPYSDKFWTVHPREMTYEWTGNRVPQPSTLQVLRGAIWNRQTRIGSNAEFLYPQSEPGFGAIGDALGRMAGRVHQGHRATRLEVRGHRLRFSNGHSVAYERLVSTIPLPELVSICDEVPEEIRAAVAKLRTNSIMVVNIGIGRPGRTDWHWAHYPENSESFFRISFPHNFADNVTPPGMSSVSAEVAYSPERPIDRDGIVDRVLNDLARVGVLKRDDPIVLRATRDVPYAYCIHDFARKAAVRAVRDWLFSNGINATGRYGHWNYFWSHEAMMSGLQAGEKALRPVAPHGEDSH